MKICVVSTKDFSYPAGGQAVAIHILNILKNYYDVSFAHFNKKLDWRRLNEFYGTQLSSGDIIEIRLGRGVPFRTKKLWFFEKHLAMRFAKKHHGVFDIFFSTSGELDFGKRGVQWINLPIPKIFYKKSSSILGKLNDCVCNRLSNSSVESMRKNVTIAVSKWTAGKIKETYGIESTVVYPPIRAFGSPVHFNFSDWQKRKSGFLSIGRISGDKRIEESVKILDILQKRHNEITYTVVGHVRDHVYFNKLKELAQSRPWMRFYTDLPRKDLENLILKNKYGIHAKPDERFGMSVAEMVYGGLLTFVPNGGGQVEIVNNVEPLIYSSTDDAVEKIDTMLSNNALQSKVFSNLQQHRMNFTHASFKKSILSIIESFGELKSS